MLKGSKDRKLIILLTVAILQGPVLYYLVEGVSCFTLAITIGLTGLILTIYFLVNLIKHRSTTKIYHVIGLLFAVFLGLSTIKGDLMEYLDFNLRKGERNKIVEEVKKGIIKSDHLPDAPFLPISQGGDINIVENAGGIVSIEFYIDRGLVDNYSAFLYTNNPDKIRKLEKEDGPFIKKLDTNWYRVAY